MHYLGYAIIVIALIFGYMRLPIPLLVFLGLISTIIFARSRRNLTQGQLVKPNPVLDGMYLFAGQMMILFSVYLLGHFAASEAGAAFMDFVTGNRS